MAKPNDPFAHPTNPRTSATPGDAARPQRGVNVPAPRAAVTGGAGPATQRGPGPLGAFDLQNRAAPRGEPQAAPRGGAQAAPRGEPQAAPRGGPFSQRTIELVQWSWSQVMPISDAAAALFYDRLFQLDQSLRSLFKSDISEQKKKLMQTLSVAVDGLNNVPKLLPVLQALGVRHHGYMVVDHHYDLVGEALLWTLREGLGDAFNSEVEKAWREVYGVIADVMKKAAAQHAAGRGAPTQPLPAAPPQAPGKDLRANPAGARATGRPVAEPPPAAYSVPPPSSAKAARTLVGVVPPWQEGDRTSTTALVISPRTVDLVQRSWAKVMPISDAAATLFYDRLFELDPSVRSLFKNDMAEQKKKLMQTLAVAVDGLNNLNKLVPVLQSLGVRHHGYMVADHHYDLVGSALLWTLREGLGDAFTKDVETAWTEVYGIIADVMKKAAAAHVGAAAGKVEVAPAPPDPRASQSVTEVMPPKRPSSVDEDADTLHYNKVLPPHEAAEIDARHLSSPPVHSQPPPSPVSAQVSPAGLVIPWSGQDMVVNVHVKMEGTPAAPPPAPAPFVPESSGPSGLTAGLAIGLLCLATSVATAILLTVGPPGDKGSLSATSVATYAVPLIIAILIVSAFTMGHLLGRGGRGQVGGPR